MKNGVNRTVFLKKGVSNAIKEAARKQERSFSWLASQILKEWLERQNIEYSNEDTKND